MGSFCVIQSLMTGRNSRWSHHPLITGGAIFLVVSVIASLSFTNRADVITGIGAFISGFFAAHRQQRRELRFGFCTPLVPAILLQILYFSTVGRFISLVGCAFFFSLNVLSICLFGLVGGFAAYVLRKMREYTTKPKRPAHDPYRRLFAVALLVSYIAMFTLPALQPIYATQKAPCTQASGDITTTDLLTCYDPHRTYLIKPRLLPPDTPRNEPATGRSTQDGKRAPRDGQSQSLSASYGSPAAVSVFDELRTVGHFLVLITKE